ncbi:MAG: type II toxin-antitoxin system MqsR family toxin [Deltaproteobacteria bacterium]|nr:type II toxin-antitoxin system MqsR family toxin [Deltaproteobacteria bacterium]
MASWLARVLERICNLAKEGNVHLTVKALAEVRGLGLGLGVQDVIDILAALSPTDYVARLRSPASSEWLYVFKPMVAGTVLYVKVVLRSNCVVVSFHEDEFDEEG